MHEAIDLLAQARPTTDPGQFYSVTQRALNTSLKVIARADDSSGIIGDACRRLLVLHPQAAQAAHVQPRRLIDWMMKFQFDGEVDYFEIDPVAYAPALGDAGVAMYRAGLEEVRAQLGALPEGSDWLGSSDRHIRWVLDWNDRRLAVLDRDFDAIIATHARDRRVAAWLEDAAEAFAEIGEFDLAIDWAEKATRFDRGHQSLHAGRYWCTLLAQHRPNEAQAARLTVFRRWPSSSTAAELYRELGDNWPTHRDEVVTSLSAQPRDAVLFALLTLKDPANAWELAHTLDLKDFDVWSDVVADYQKVDPIAVLPVHRRLVEGQLADADAHNYRRAARRLATMRTLAAGSDSAPEVDALVLELRETHRRRPRLQTEFDRAGLP
jgi:tetratricopeptide (TPR) repeat protein